MIHPSRLLAVLLLSLPLQAELSPQEFAARCRDLGEAAAGEGRRAVAGEAPGWLFLTSELRHLGLGEFWKERLEGGDPAQAITAYHEALKDMGVELVVVPVPAKAAIYPEKLTGEAVAASVSSNTPFYEQLRSRGVTVLDLASDYRQEREREKMYAEQDSHWSPAGARLAAQRLAELPPVRQLFPSDPPVPRAGEELSISGDLADALPGAVSGRERLTVYRASDETIEPDDAAPVLLIGDSHTVVYSQPAGTIRHHTTGAGFADHVQALLGTRLAVATNASSGGDAARALVTRRSGTSPSFWEGKKLVIWLFAEREFTQGRWREIPPQVRRR